MWCVYFVALIIVAVLRIYEANAVLTQCWLYQAGYEKRKRLLGGCRTSDKEIGKSPQETCKEE